ncbi:glycosyltransferase family 8 protein [Aeromonas caviae]|uniref:glycosyltransferase family 8 protein n=1 Tax=Aeromonas caviae TaxID=648 RepID=UPI00244A4BE2|nr:glycosyltransferase family 8 protein [Aeromonas caviae]MDH0474535.1 glycosyltransferase family 8 protein [Aeromonas caviae]
MIHVAFCSDSKFQKPLEIAIFSILRSSADSMKLHFHIVQLDDFNCTNIEAMVSSYQANVSFYTMNTHLYEKGRFSQAMYGRLYLPELIDCSVSRVIYLDCDVIVASDLLELWQSEIDGYEVAAVPEPKSQIKKYLTKKYNIDDYFNSGCLLIDLDKVRGTHNFFNVRQFIEKNNDLIYPDQDALNYIYSNNWKPLPEKWNQMSLEFYEEPSIIHYALSKPWGGTGNKNAYLYEQCVNEYPYELPFFTFEFQRRHILDSSELKRTKIYQMLSYLYWTIKSAWL